MSGHVLRMTPAMFNVVIEELEKLKAADFIEPSISLFLPPIVCVKKTDEMLKVRIDFGWSIKM